MSGQRPVNTSRRYQYHYTDKQGAQGIAQTGKIYPSTNVTSDAILGKGTYTTDVTPANRKADILENNYGAGPGRHKQGKVDYYIKVPADSVPSVKANDPSRSVYKSGWGNTPLDLSRIEGAKVGRTGVFEHPIGSSALNEALDVNPRRGGGGYGGSSYNQPRYDGNYYY